MSADMKTEDAPSEVSVTTPEMVLSERALAQFDERAGEYEDRAMDFATKIAKKIGFGEPVWNSEWNAPVIQIEEDTDRFLIWLPQKKSLVSIACWHLAESYNFGTDDEPVIWFRILGPTRNMFQLGFLLDEYLPPLDLRTVDHHQTNQYLRRDRWAPAGEVRFSWSKWR